MSDHVFDRLMRDHAPKHHRRASSHAYDEADGREQMDYLQCCHCGGHVHVTAATEKHIRYCMECNQFTCPNPACNQGCTPFEKRLEAFEKGRTKDLLARPDELI